MSPPVRSQLWDRAIGASLDGVCGKKPWLRKLQCALNLLTGVAKSVSSCFFFATLSDEDRDICARKTALKPHEVRLNWVVGETRAFRDVEISVGDRIEGRDRQDKGNNKGPSG